MELTQEQNQGSEKPELYRTAECESYIPCQLHICLTLTVYKMSHLQVYND